VFDLSESVAVQSQAKIRFGFRARFLDKPRFGVLRIAELLLGKDYSPLI